jgi:transcriptional regulator with XRE-family HTH domain
MDATPRLNTALFDQRSEAKGASSETEKAALVGIDPSTLWRFRRGEIGPRLEVARRMAERLEVTVDELWPKAA